MRFELETLLLLDLLASVELSLLLVMVGRLLRGEPGLRLWVGGMASAAAGRLITMLAGDAVPFASIVGAPLLALSPALLWAGIREHCNRARPLVAILSSVVLVAIISLFAPGPECAVALANAGWSAAVVWTLLRHDSSLRPAGTHFVAAIFLAHGVFQMGCALYRLPPGAPLLHAENDLPRVAMTLESIVFMVAFNFVAMGLASQRLLGKLRDAARTDGLTGLLNRWALLSDGERVVEFCRRRGRPCAVVIADIDHFKRLNDSKGHAAGDEALRYFAEEASKAAGQWVVLGRYGGEEFCAVLPGAGEGRAWAWAEELRVRIAASGRFTVSFGVAVGSGAELDLTALIARADEALYRAKEQGRDRVCA